MSSPMNEEEATRRLFFALWPDEALARHCFQLGAELAERHGVRRLPLENLHLTLAFLGPCTAEQQTCVEALADSIQLPPFSLTLDRLGHWPKPQVLWLGGEAPPSLQALVTAINAGLPACGLQAERRPYAPHMTLLRKLRRAGEFPAIEPLEWPVSDFCLAVSETRPEGARYRVIRRWGLEG